MVNSTPAKYLTTTDVYLMPRTISDVMYNNIIVQQIIPGSEDNTSRISYHRGHSFWNYVIVAMVTTTNMAEGVEYEYWYF